MTAQSSQQGKASREKKVAFLGPFASYSHQATKSVFSPGEWELTPTVTIKDVFETVQSGVTSYGVVPFENSTHGIVTFTIENLGDRTNSFPDLQVCGEIYLDVHHFLLGRKSKQDSAVPAGAERGAKAVPLADLSHIKQLYSHPQGFGQTTAFVGKFLRGVGTIDVTSTSKAAELAAADPTGTSAAIAGEIAAEMHGLDVLARCIEDREDNTTRFFVIRRGSSGDGLPAQLERLRGGLATGPPPPADAVRAPHKSLLSFTVPHHAPGALADVLDCFKRCGLNLTSINSVPSLVAPFQYLFFVEFEGSRYDDPADRVKQALEGVDRAAQAWRFLGTWENQR
ncbi:prephenate dehydratase-like protein [Thozetella sp. PMI_491]|nr:prephenate dehydratase-like protein [Thozetella sp. PMI_491]